MGMRAEGAKGAPRRSGVFHFGARSLARSLAHTRAICLISASNEAHRGGGIVAPFDPNPCEIASFDFPWPN